MLITEYTSYDEVRAVLGVSSTEIPDKQLSLAIYGDLLWMQMNFVELSGFSGTLPAEYATVKAIAEASRTTTQQLLYTTTRAFATYAVAFEVAQSLSMSAPKAQADGKRSLTRFSDQSTFRDTVKAITDRLSSLKHELKNIGAVAVETSTLSLLSVITPDVDVVTNL